MLRPRLTHFFLKATGLAFVMVAGLIAPAATAAGVYPSSTLGYDVSYATRVYPATIFNFAIVSVTRGKALVDNKRFVSEFAWARFGAAAAPTIYMNLNAPYGSTVAGHIGSPKACAAATNSEPTACEGYNYGYNAAKHSYAYAKANNAVSAIWWLDIETANSWSEDPAVNDATLQGAIDYLNAQGIRVGVYSMAFMWREIMGVGFVPKQALGGSMVTTPVWMPVGIMSQVAATNSCLTRTSFIPGNPIWLVQYEASSTAIDQNLAC